MTLAFRVFVYIRVSTEEQAKEGFSISAQKERNTQFYMSQNWDLHDFYIDEGVSAKDTNRPELTRMLKEIEEFRKANPKDGIVVLTYKLDRLTRSILDLFQLLKTFEELNVGFKSTTEVFDTTTAMGRLFIAITGAMAQWERENLGERVRMGLQEKARQGKYPGGSAAYGYRVENGDLVVHEEEAATVRMIYEMYASGKNLDEISYSLTQLGIPTRTGIPWGDTTVGYILKNPVYYGKIRWNFKDTTHGEYFEADGRFESIISEDLFEQVQKKREMKRKYHPREIASEWIFTGKLRCPLCGHKLVGHNNSHGKPPGDYLYYRCKNKNKFGYKCKFTSIKSSKVERRFLEYIREFIANNAAFEVAATAVETKTDTSCEQLERIERLRQEIDKVKGNKAKWQRAFAADVISLDDLRDRTEEDNRRIEMLENQIRELHPEPVTPDAKLSAYEMFQLLIDVEANWEVATIDEKKEILSFLVDRIVVHWDKPTQTLDLDIVFN